MSYRLIDANSLVDLVDQETLEKLNEVPCIYVDIDKLEDQHFDLNEITEASKKDLLAGVIDICTMGIENTGHSDVYTTGFCNALIWIKNALQKDTEGFEPIDYYKVTDNAKTDPNIIDAEVQEVKAE